MNNSDYTPVIGLEVHVQLATKSKMFSRCSADWFGKAPNTVVCPVSLGLPGALPVPNKKAIQWTILLGKALQCSINSVSKFDRKHYFYPDLPKAYQISQYDLPFAYDGWYDLDSKVSGQTKRIRIKRVHLEEDTGKLIHEGNETLVDFNRAGMPLMEIVTEPDFDNSDDVKQFLEELQILVRYVGISEADMEKGSMRLEPNISVRKPGESGYPDYKVEVKNINSFNYAKRAIDFEVPRHIELLSAGEIPIQETRGYNEGKGITVSQRVKESADDYRYFPEPDIPPFELTAEFLAEIDEMMPELPQERIKRYIEMGVSAENAYILTRSRSTCEFFEKTVTNLKQNASELTFKSKTLEEEIAKLMVNKAVSTDMTVEEFCDQCRRVLKPIETDSNALEEAVVKVLESNTRAVSDYKAGKVTIIMFLVGQIMKEMQGRADAQIVKSSLESHLKT